MSYHELGRGFSGGSALSGAGFGGASLYEQRLPRRREPSESERAFQVALPAEREGLNNSAYAWLWTAIAAERRGN